MEAKCPIWGTDAEHIPGYERRDGTAVNSPRAGGSYFISGTAEVNLRRLSDEDKVKLTQEIVENNYRNSIPTITSTTLDGIPDRKFPQPDVRASYLLRYFAKKSDFLGQELEFPMEARTYDGGSITILGSEIGSAYEPLFAWSASLREEEVTFLLRMLEERKFLKLDSGDPVSSVVITPAGIAELEGMESVAGPSDQAFIAMWFDASTNKAYSEGIEKAVRKTGHIPMRIDRKEHINKIDDEIVLEIKRSKFVVADFTSDIDKPRGGVYFEAGFAMGMNIPVIWTCHKDIIDQVHFDTRQFNHIVWSDPDELCDKLTKRILAVIGAGPHRPES